MPNDDLTNMIRLVSEPYWLWRCGVIDDNANLDDSRSTKKTDDSNMDKDEQMGGCEPEERAEGSPQVDRDPGSSRRRVKECRRIRDRLSLR